MSSWSLTDNQTSAEIENNPLLAAFGYAHSGDFVRWSDGDLTYTLNVGDNMPTGETVGTWTDALTQSIEMAHADISAVAMVTFTEIADSVNGSDGADIDYWAYSSPGDNTAGYSYGVDGSGVYIDMADVYEPNSYTGDGLAYGGINYRTVIHEILHNLGLGHPHDGNAVLPGVSSPYDTGDHALNQNIYTVMSYNSVRQVDDEGGETTGYPFTYGTVDRSFGVLGTLDIAMLQVLYGANMAHATGNDVYDIVDVNAAGTHYKAIWDAGGTDEFRYSGSRDVQIDLRAATLDVADGMLAGGLLSKADGIFGGYNIAFGTVIENATGGAGADRITGNQAANILLGGAGADRISGGSGQDTLNGGSGQDTLFGDEGADVLIGGDDVDTLHFAASDEAVTIDLFLSVGSGGDAEGDHYSEIEAVVGSELDDILYGDNQGNFADGGAGSDMLHMGRGDDTLLGGTGDDTLKGGSGNDEINGGGGNDVLDGGKGSDVLIGGDGFDTLRYQSSLMSVDVDLSDNSVSGGDGDGDSISGFEAIIGSSHADHLTGSDGANVINGGIGRDWIDGGAGDDLMIGGQGRDTFVFASGNDTIDGGTGFDIVVVNAQMSDFSVTDFGAGAWEIVETATGEVNTLTDIETIEFLDFVLV